MTEQPQASSPNPKLQALENLFREALPGLEIETSSNFDELVVTAAPQDIPTLCRAAKRDKRLDFDYLRCLCAMEEDDQFSIVYHLHSTRKAHRAVLKTRVPRSQAVVASVTSVWRGADWHEREAAEMFGLEFQGHPHPAPLLLWEGFEEHPLRKDYPLGGREGTGEG
jgi:NADH-quinone oxidoreductase subunit C